MDLINEGLWHSGRGDNLLALYYFISQMRN